VPTDVDDPLVLVELPHPGRTSEWLVTRAVIDNFFVKDGHESVDIMVVHPVEIEFDELAMILRSGNGILSFTV
jgi:hypothetical protein